MKTKLSFLSSIVLLLLISCAKDTTPNSDFTIANKLSGNFKVTEHAQTLTYSSTFGTIDTVFYSWIEAVDDSTIKFMDTTSNIRRVYRGPVARVVKDQTRKIWAFGYINGDYSQNNDTLHLDVYYGVIGAATYRIIQTWIRQ